MKTFKNTFSTLIFVVLWSFLLTAVGTAAHADGATYRTQVTPWELERYLDVY